MTKMIPKGSKVLIVETPKLGVSAGCNFILEQYLQRRYL